MPQAVTPHCGHSGSCSSHSCDRSPTKEQDRGPESLHPVHYCFQWASTQHRDITHHKSEPLTPHPIWTAALPAPHKSVQRTVLPLRSSKEKGIEESEVQISQTDLSKEAMQSRAQTYLNTTSAKAKLKLIATAALVHFLWPITLPKS